MTKLSFKDYYQSKVSLLEQDNSVIHFKTRHDVYKYCKVPMIVNGNKVYVAFKPKDKIVVEWDRIGENIIPKKFIINENEHIPTWNPQKMKSWVEQTTIQNLDTF